MFERDDRDDGHILAFGFERHVDDDFVNAAVGEDQEAIGWREDEVTHDDLAESLDVFEEHGLTLTVRADDEVMVGQ